MTTNIVTVRQATKQYGTKVVLNDVNFAIPQGRIVGLLGASGSGKSTLARCLLGLDNLASGSIEWSTARVQAVFQHPYAAMNPLLTVEETIVEACGPLTKFTRRERAQQLMDLVQLPHHLLSHYPHQLSGGQQQRVMIAQALGAKPHCLILDEPTSSLDATTQRHILALLKQLQTEQQLSYCFISHHIAAMLTIADEIYVLHEGMMIDHFRPCEALHEQRHPYTKKLVSLWSS